MRGHIFSQPITAYRGYCFVAAVPESMGFPPESDRRDADLELREDGRLLGPGDCDVDEVASSGSGRYSCGPVEIYFSTSDNSDPRTNGRAYELKMRASGRGAANALLNIMSLVPAPDLRNEGTTWVEACPTVDLTAM
jgi:hypothetical protein